MSEVGLSWITWFIGLVFGIMFKEPLEKFSKKLMKREEEKDAKRTN